MDAGDGSRTIRLVVDGHAPGAPDLPLVDALARLQLAARRLGWEVRLVDPCPHLCQLLHLVGLADVVIGRRYRSSRTGRPKAGNSSG